MDFNLRIQSIIAHCSGSIHDSTIFRNSKLRARFEAEEFHSYILIGDTGYAVSLYMLTPKQYATNDAEALYNESRVVSRNSVERSYGI